jgi:hypothetical protein
MRHPVVMNIGLRGPISLALKKPVAAYSWFDWLLKPDKVAEKCERRETLIRGTMS